MLKLIEFVEQNKDKLDWYYLLKNPNALFLFEKNPDKINWWFLSSNPCAVHLLKQNQGN